MLHLLYVFAFTVLAFFAVGNMIRNLMMLGAESQRPYHPNTRQNPRYASPHPELLDERGKMVNEPYLVMRSISVDDARERLDALYKASPGATGEAHDETSG